jgi:hypothetical protein
MCRSPQERDLRKALFDGLIGHQRALEPDSAAQTRLTAPRQSPPVAHSDLPTARSRAPTKTPSSRPQDRLLIVQCASETSRFEALVNTQMRHSRRWP